ncbi:MAG: hypothetical protein RJA70_4278 [Pseudomonadota bacterium]|jgi:50S ribosomal protein L16 3-hydroxylase
MQRPERFLNGLSPEEFLRDYWQQRPLLCRGALTGYCPPLDQDELAGLALEAEVESRIVETRGWSLRRGPFAAELFDELGERDWTLLIQDLDQHVPEVGELLGLLDFLPSWRVDDVMASFAATGGSVGPHYDQYDVFLLQVEGERHWQISEHFDRARLEDSELCILSDFQAEAEWTLGPGDLLYLPPGVAHFGVARSPCVTYSLGCRAPSVGDVVRQLVSLRLEQLHESGAGEAKRYRDPELAPQSPLAHAPGAISSAAIKQARGLLEQQLHFSDDELARGFAGLVTQPKALFARDEIITLSGGELKRALRAPSFVRRKGSRMAYAPVTEGHCFFVDGIERPLPAPNGVNQQAFLERLCAREALSWADVPTETEHRDLFEGLVLTGDFEPSEK